MQTNYSNSVAHQKNMFFANLTKKIGIHLIHSHWTAIVALLSQGKEVSAPDYMVSIAGFHNA